MPGFKMTGIRRKRRPVRAGVRGRRFGVSKGKGYQNILKTKRSFYTAEVPQTWDIFYDGTNWQNYRRAGVFHLNDVVNYTEFTNLFDCYQITGVKIQFVPVFNSGDPEINASSGAIPSLTYVRDYDDATTPNTEQDLLEYGAHHRLYLDRMRSIYIRNPRVRMGATSGDTGTQSGLVETPKKNQWLDCASPVINHYGIKWYMPVDSMNTNIRIRVYLTYYMRFKRTI